MDDIAGHSGVDCLVIVARLLGVPAEPASILHQLGISPESPSRIRI